MSTLYFPLIVDNDRLLHQYSEYNDVEAYMYIATSSVRTVAEGQQLRRRLDYLYGNSFRIYPTRRLFLNLLISGYNWTSGNYVATNASVPADVILFRLNIAIRDIMDSSYLSTQDKVSVLYEANRMQILPQGMYRTLLQLLGVIY